MRVYTIWLSESGWDSLCVNMSEGYGACLRADFEWILGKFVYIHSS